MEYETAKAWLEARAHRSIDKRSEDFQIMESILKNHPDYSTWKLKNVEYFKITRAPKKKHLQVYMKLEGKSDLRIVSWVACVKGKKRKTNSLSSAMRSTIASQISEYNFRHPVKTCAICESYSNIEVDHYPKKFRDLKREFLAENEEAIPSLYFLHSKYIFSSKNSKFENDWYQYHLQNAKYRYLCDKCNQSTH